MRLPFLPTLIVAAAVAAMAGLGIWQLRRAEWKQEMVARYEAAKTLPPVAWPGLPPKDETSLLYRRAAGFCTRVTGWRAVAGRNQAGQPGWSHIAACQTGGLEGPGMQVAMGWALTSAPPKAWRGGAVTGIIVPDRAHRIRLIADRPPTGLQPLASPSPKDLPDNHRVYAIQWFLFAAAAAIIYLLALRRRQRSGDPPPPAPRA